MVIQCAECKTRFKLADDKIKPGGIKVRCAKCKHIFKVMPPEPFEETAPPASTPPEGSMAEWQEEKLPGELAESATAEKEEEKAPSGFDFAAETKTEALSDFPSGESQEEISGPVEFSFEEEEGGEDLLSESAPPPEESAEIPEEEKPEAAEFSFEQEESSGPIEFSFEEEEKEGLSWEEAEEPTDEFELEEAAKEPLETEEFDLSEMPFGEEDSQKEEPTTFAPEETEAETTEPSGATEPSQELPVPEIDTEKPEQPSPAPPSQKSPLRGLMIFVLILLLALGGIAGYLFLRGESLDVAQMISRFTGEQESAPAAGQISLKDISSLFVANQEAGQLFVIQGQAYNEFPDTRSAIEIKGILHDQKGAPLLQQTVFCGNPINEKELQELPFAKIEERMNNQFGDSLSNLNIAPGAAIPFTIVFKNLPEEMAEFTVEVADSRPGSK